MKTPDRIWIWKPDLHDEGSFVEIRMTKTKGFQEYRRVEKPKAKKKVVKK